MGQQQLLLILLSVIIIAIAVSVGISLFQAAVQASNRDAITLDLQHLSSLAQQHRRVPDALGGGGNTFANFRFPTTLAMNDNGTYQHIKQSHAKNHIHFEAIGVETGRDGTNPIRIEVRVDFDTLTIIQHN